MDVFDRADIDAACWLRSDDELDIPVEFPGNDDLLLVATGQIRNENIDTRCADVVFLDETRRLLVTARNNMAAREFKTINGLSSFLAGLGVSIVSIPMLEGKIASHKLDGAS